MLLCCDIMYYHVIQHVISPVTWTSELFLSLAIQRIVVLSLAPIEMSVCPHNFGIIKRVAAWLSYLVLFAEAVREE
jgi:hypothetical protein